MFKLELFRRSLMWLAGTALPATPLLQHRLQSAIRAIVCAVMGATLLSALIVAFLYGSFSYLVSEGMSPLVSFALVGGIALFASGSLMLMALRQINGAALIKEDLALFGGSQPLDPLRRLAEQLPMIQPIREAGSGVRDIASAFMDGLMNGRPESASITPLRTGVEDPALRAAALREAERLPADKATADRSFL